MAIIIDAKESAFTSGAKVGAFKGAAKNLLNSDYHSLDSYWSSSDLKYMSANSPMHFKAKYIDKELEPMKQTPAMILGSLVHCMVLTPDDFEHEFFVMPDLNFRTNEGKAAKQEILAANVGKMSVTDEQIAIAQKMRESIMSNPEAARLLEPMKKELAFFWTCPFSNLNFKAKLDGSGGTHFIELKSAISAEPGTFQRQCYNMNYDLSLAHYRQGISHVMGCEPKAYFIVVEKTPPYICQVYLAGDSLFETGHTKWLDAVNKLEQGVKAGKWPGYADVEETPTLDAPPWAYDSKPATAETFADDVLDF